MKRIHIKPVITEKSMMVSGRGVFTFAVPCAMGKKQAAYEIERAYHVHVVNTTSITMHGKMRRVGRKAISVKKSNWKKIMVKLKQGETIEAFHIGEEGKK